MNGHSVFYYPYGSFQDKQSPLLRAAALYFDKLYILDPVKASFGRIGAGEVEEDVRLLEDEGILERVSPEEVLAEHESTISAAIQRDLSDVGFQKLCAEKGTGTWTLALAKVPKELREEPAMQPAEQAMKRMMHGYAEVYDEYQESSAGITEYRYADYPFAVGESIMLNHALVGGLLHVGATPVTDDEIHSRILNHKLERAAQEIPQIREAMADARARQGLASNQLAAQALTDFDLGVIPGDVPLPEILKYRRKHQDELESARSGLQWMAREIEHSAWTPEFQKEVFHKTIPKLNKELEPARRSWADWLKPAGIALGGVAVVLGVIANPLTPVALAVAGVTLSKDVVIGGLELWQDPKKNRNALHYLLKFKAR